MSQSPLARTTRRKLPAFAHTPSRLSHSTSQADLRDTSSPEEEKDPKRSVSKRVSTSSASASPTSFASPRLSTPVRESRYKSTGTSTHTPDDQRTPRTPKIQYAPYATSTPPSGLSKSSSIPFDMAASLKAGRIAEEEQRKRESSPIVVGDKKPKRFVRRKNLFQRVSEAPETIWSRLAMWYPLTIEEIFPDIRFANPISLGLHIVHWSLLAPLWSSREEPESVLRSAPVRTGVRGRWDRYEEENRSLGVGLGGRWTTVLFTAILLLIACANSVYLFTKFRTYDMQLRSANDPVKSPHASPVPAPRPQPEEDVFSDPSDPKSSDTNERKALKWLGWAIVGVTKWSFWAILSIFGHRGSETSAFSSPEQKIQSLRVWEPPEFCLALFCAYPPSAPLLSYLLTPRHPFLTPLLHLVTSFLLSHLASSYHQLVKDRMMLSAEVMREYDRRFVYKKVFGARVDRAVQTEQGGFGHKSVVDNSRVFVVRPSGPRAEGTGTERYS